MKTLAFILLLFFSASIYAAEEVNNNEPYRLQNGSLLFVNKDNTMRMVDTNGKPIEMKDGVEMRLTNGDLIMMKNKRIWRHDHRKMK